ncbi:MAG: mechanosensitive ion channel family protein [Methanobacteriota archaeon]|nr:MAG: mechanosensitive ion channel family protein [Euryarchaeota archaeon]
MSLATRDLLIWGIILAIALVIGTAEFYFPNPVLEKLTWTAIVIAGLFFVIRILFKTIVDNRIVDPKMRYSFAKGVVLLFYALTVVAVAVIWIENTQALLVSSGIIAAGIAIALQDVFKNVAGSIYAVTSGVYRVGDRIEVNGIFGDVIDIGLASTTLMEFGGWIHGDQPTGRLTVLPNGQVVTSTVYNYTKDYNFIWDEISVPVTYSSDWKKAASLFSEILEEQTRESVAHAHREIRAIGEQYYFPKKVVDPQVFLALTDNWVTFSLRYVTPVRDRRAMRDRLSRRILEAIEGSDRVEIASETMTITGTHTVELKNRGTRQERHLGDRSADRHGEGEEIPPPLQRPG